MKMKKRLLSILLTFALVLSLMPGISLPAYAATDTYTALKNNMKQKGVEDLFEIDSAATSREEIGNTPHYGTVGKLREVGIPLVPHRARQMTMADYDHYDYLIGMDSANIRNMERIAGGRGEKIYKMLDFVSGEGRGRDVADPWYTDNFDATYNDLVKGLTAFWEFLEKKGEV